MLLKGLPPILAGLLVLHATPSAQNRIQATGENAGGDAQLVETGTAAPHGAGHGSVSVQLGFYDHSDSGDGNPFLDEELTVIEPVIVFEYNATDRLSYGGVFSFDYVSSASIDRLSAFPDQSGASGDTYFGLDMHTSYRTSDFLSVGGHLGASVEYDYSSVSLGFNLLQTLEEADATLSYSVDAFFDSVDIIRFDGTQAEGTDSRTTLSGSLNWYQVISPTTHSELGITIADQSGFLETPYNAVVFEDPLAVMPMPNPNLANMAIGTEITEELPDSRLRTALFGKVRTSLALGQALELGGRLYHDDWGIDSVTLEPRYYSQLCDAVDMRLRYRFYTQTESDFFQDHFTSMPEFRTQDSDLAGYSAHTLGSKFTWFRGERHSFDVGLDYTLRSDGLDQLFTLFGWTWSF